MATTSQSTAKATSQSELNQRELAKRTAQEKRQTHIQQVTQKRHAKAHKKLYEAQRKWENSQQDEVDFRRYMLTVTAHAGYPDCELTAIDIVEICINWAPDIMRIEIFDNHQEDVQKTALIALNQLATAKG